MKRIVIFYFLEGNTRNATKDIAKGLGAEFYEIELLKSISK